MEAYERVLQEYPLLKTLDIDKSILRAIIGLAYAIGNRDGVREGAELFNARFSLERQNEAQKNKAAD